MALMCLLAISDPIPKIHVAPHHEAECCYQEVCV